MAGATWRLVISAKVLERLRADGERRYPEESCGALLGQAVPHGWRIDDVQALENAAESDAGRRFAVAPEELVRLYGHARGCGLEIAGFYHSHPDHEAWWSESDLEEAQWMGCFTVITEVRERRAGATRAFVLARDERGRKRFAPAAIERSER